MLRILHLLNNMTGKITIRLVAVVSLSILITAVVSYEKLYQVTETNSNIRIDRAARAATALFTERLNSEFSGIYDPHGRPTAIRLKGETDDRSLTFRNEFDVILADIGATNQGAANLFKLNPETNAFDRFATTFRKPDGTMPPAMSIGSGHPAYDNIVNNKIHVGEVPVMERMRLAYLMPIQRVNGDVAGALAVDVGWVDDLVSARTDLRVHVIIATVLILLLVATYGAVNMSKELKPLRELAQYANDLASEAPAIAVPYKNRNDEIGVLAQGLERVVALQDKLANLAYKDVLTGLGNRSRYLRDIEISLNNCLSSKCKSTLIHLDIDNFKQINDAFGQKAGDDLLKIVASQVTSIFGQTSKIARLTSDQFTILVEDDASVTKVAELTETLLMTLRQPYHLTEGEIHLTASIGIVLLQHDAENVDEAHRNAGLALRKAKTNGGDQAVFFSSEMNDVLQDQIRLDRMLKIAIEEREIEIHFQPQISPSTNSLAGLEVLARWNHSTEGSISPGKFIPVAESSGQIVALGTLVLDLACQQAAKWNEENFDFKHISVNVSPIQLWQSNFIDVLKNTLDRYNVAGENIIIEITESVFVDHCEHRIAKVLAAIRAVGVKVSLDDFGSGYSSLGYLNRLPFDQLKIDRSFVTDIDKDLRKQQVLQGVLGLGNGLGFNIVVEGAETYEEVSVIKGMGCHAIQGFYFARPSHAAKIPNMVRQITQPNVKAISA